MGNSKKIVCSFLVADLCNERICIKISKIKNGYQSRFLSSVAVKPPTLGGGYKANNTTHNDV